MKGSEGHWPGRSNVEIGRFSDKGIWNLGTHSFQVHSLKIGLSVFFLKKPAPAVSHRTVKILQFTVVHDTIRQKVADRAQCTNRNNGACSMDLRTLLSRVGAQILAPLLQVVRQHFS